MKKRLFRKGIVSDYLPWLLIAVSVLVILLLSIFVFKEKGFDLLLKIKSFFGGR